jgi:hypothetical protein
MRARAARTLLLVAVLCATVVACGDPSAHWEVGGLYSTSDGGEFGVVKILALEPDAVSIRIYRERFPARPTSIDPESLSLGSVDDPDGFGIGHMPIAPHDFALWFPVHLATEPVTDEELEGYRYWKESGGGTFDFGRLSETELAPSENQE